MRTIGLVGLGPTAEAALDDMDQGYEFWGMPWNPMFIGSLAFDIHDRSFWNDKVELYNNWNVPILMQDEYSDIPVSVKYPLKAVTDIIGRDYFCSSFAYMIGYAMFALNKGDTIKCYGVDLHHNNSEYADQRPNAEYLLGVAQGIGLNIEVVDGSSLLVPKYTGETTSGRYGWNMIGESPS